MKNLFFFLMVLVGLQACSGSGNPSGSNSQSAIPLPDSASILGDSPDHKFRLFKGQQQEKTTLNLLQLNNLQTIPVVTLPGEPKFFWSGDFKYLITENIQPDSAFKREVVFFDLATLAIAHRYPGELMTYDGMNNTVFFYTSQVDRQSVNFVYLDNPTQVTPRDVIAAPADKLPAIILMPKDKQARVKAFTTDDTPVNFMIHY